MTRVAGATIAATMVAGAVIVAPWALDDRGRQREESADLPGSRPYSVISPGQQSNPAAVPLSQTPRILSVEALVPIATSPVLPEPMLPVAGTPLPDASDPQISEDGAIIAIPPAGVGSGGAGTGAGGLGGSTWGAGGAGGAGSTPDNVVPPIAEQISTIGTSIPAVSFGATDGLPATLARGQSYTVMIPVLAADAALQQTASILGRGVNLDSACTDVPLVFGNVTQVTCTVTVRANAVSAWVRAASNGVGSRLLRHTVDPSSKALASMSAVLSADTIPYGSPRTAIVSLTAPGYSPTGTVSVVVDGSIVLPGRLVGGAAVVNLPASLTVGTHTVEVSYDGDAWVAGVATVTRQLKVIPAASATTATLDLGALGAAVVARVTVDGVPYPPGSVTVSENGTVLATAAMSSGSATAYLPPSLASGTHTLTVRYSGSGSFASSATTLVIDLP